MLFQSIYPTTPCAVTAKVLAQLIWIIARIKSIVIVNGCLFWILKGTLGQISSTRLEFFSIFVFVLFVTKLNLSIVIFRIIFEAIVYITQK